jgi:hypothetical protein
MSIERALNVGTIQGAVALVRALREFTADLDMAIDIARTQQSSLDYESAIWLMRECHMDPFTAPLDWRTFYKAVILSSIRRFEVPWLSTVLRGRDRLWTKMPRDQRQCLVDLDVFESPPSEEARRFWDELNSLARFQEAQAQLSSGTRAEILAFQTERSALIAVGRPDLWPIMASMDDSSLGYDIQSFAHDGNIEEPRYIEVKGFKGTRADFFVSRGQWEAAKRFRDQYRLQVWSIDREELFCLLSFSDLATHIPDDRGAGRWQELLVSLKS